MHINSIFSLHFIFPHPPPALIIINFRFLSAIGEWLRSWYGCTPTPPGGQRLPSGLWPPSRGWIQWNSLGPPLALSPFSRQTNLKCNNMAIVVYCYENLLIVSRSSGSKVWMGLNGLRILHAEVLLAFSGKHFPDGPSIVASSIHGVHLERDRDPNAEGFLQLLLCRLPPQIRCSITLRDPRIPG